MLQKVEVNISKEIGIYSTNNIRTTKHNVRGKSIAVQRNMMLRTEVKCMEHSWLHCQSKNMIPECVSSTRGIFLQFLSTINFLQ
jgi:hypothetical protein